jgi:hypothetical protein
VFVLEKKIQEMKGAAAKQSADAQKEL